MRKITDHVTMYKAYEELWEVIYSGLIHDQSAVKLRTTRERMSFVG